MSVETLTGRAPIENKGTRQKWDVDGVARRFRGTTVVSHVVPESPMWLAQRRIYRDLIERGVSRDYGMLPPSSFHMTVIEGLKTRDLGDRWPAWLDDAEDFPDAVWQMVGRLREARIPKPAALNLEVTGLEDLRNYVKLELEPSDEETLKELTAFREAVAETLEIDFPGLDTYRFHSSMAYRVTQAGDDAALIDELHETYLGWVKEVGRIDLEDPAFCIFDDMLAFAPLYRFR
ncbi:DUF1868 domain-containing protein [Corynebacterium otitidis]|uniref:DUF1868 domain-containing protein n=1 Tax=Corynebacterium otitidis ATCC 51513 TaxID=883169 RepID=I7L9M6_9CORY|nr:DUF1868 domain-containing protein [Corynebacterium otitidis]EJZ81631.1 hypothetical protein HMPREF9719_01452 [Corynebacterium otitidis ATCC 51513]CCI83897.1 hypothetical protein BN46_1172 [Corynebacterium otitidis ATCC 51513]